MSDAAAPSAAPPKRLIITKMRMENFKSYYGVQEVGPFHKVRAQATHKILELPIPLSLFCLLARCRLPTASLCNALCTCYTCAGLAAGVRRKEADGNTAPSSLP